MSRSRHHRAARGASARGGSPRGSGVADALARATRAHQAGRLAEAEGLYRSVLAERPGHPAALNLLGALHHQRGDHEAAIRLLRRAVKASPRAAEAHYNLAETLRAAGRFEQAAESYRAVIALAPDAADAHYGLGNALYELRDLAGAEQAYRQSLVHAPADAEAHNNLGNVLLDLGSVEAAAAAYRAALAARPNYAAAHANLGNALLQLGEEDAARASYAQAVAVDPRLAEGYLGLGLVEERQGRLEAATAKLERAAAVDPGNADAHLALVRVHLEARRPEKAIEAGRKALAAQARQAEAHALLGRAYADLFRWPEAEAQFREALAADPEHVDALLRLAEVLLDLGRAGEARECYGRLLASRPDMAAALSGLGHALQQMGQFDEAARLFRRALAVDPKLTSAWYGLAMSRHIEPETELPALEQLARDDSLSDDQRRDLLFVLADLNNGRAAYDAAFACFRAANDLRKKTSRFDKARWSRLISTLIACFSGDMFAERRGWGNDSELPVFVLGMPRSGTTLVEQIIASHPDAFGAGELYDVQHLATALGERAGGLPFPQSVPRLRQADVAALAERHLASLRRRAPGARRIVDKMPGNFIHIGLIALLFPRAKIVHCRRDPLDSCVSCYFQNFRTLEFTSDLDDLGHYYREYERLMRHWHAVLPLPVFDVQYERLVAAHAEESRRLIDFVNLPWDDRCLSFHETRRAIRTASVWQARQPLFASSVGRWRPYEAHLGPLKRALGLAQD